MDTGVRIMSTADEVIDSVDEVVEKNTTKVISNQSSDTQRLFIVAPPTTGKLRRHKTQTQIYLNMGVQLHVLCTCILCVCCYTCTLYNSGRRNICIKVLQQDIQMYINSVFSNIMI